ncbi:type IV pilin protein [Balneatrix alpica]|uniref:type IV pilin protein n=1 Tax=Balneatrix alpica TaxID=75684 RepID=UPI002738A266|nr:type IV pilin protein [Balneatrix alpica]
MVKQQGFTLIEAMIVVAIVGILAAIAYPSYQRHVQDSRRADAATVLMQQAMQMQRHYSNNFSYLGAATGGANTGAPTGRFIQAPLDVPAADSFYTITINAATQQTYTLWAAPRGAQANDRCGTLTLNEQGVKGVINGNGQAVADCW